MKASHAGGAFAVHGHLALHGQQQGNQGGQAQGPADPEQQRQRAHGQRGGGAQVRQMVAQQHLDALHVLVRHLEQGPRGGAGKKQHGQPAQVGGDGPADGVERAVAGLVGQGAGQPAGQGPGGDGDRGGQPQGRHAPGRRLPLQQRHDHEVHDVEGNEVEQGVGHGAGRGQPQGLPVVPREMQDVADGAHVDGSLPRAGRGQKA